MLKPSISLLFAALLLCVAHGAHAQQEIEKGLIQLEVEGVPTYFTDLALSPDGTRLSALAMGGRIYQYDVSNTGRLVPVWSSLKGGRLTYVEYSACGKYLVCEGLSVLLPGNAAKSFGSAKNQATDELAVLDAADGHALLSIPRGYSIQVLGNTAFVSTPTGFEWYSLPQGALLRKEAFARHECAILSPDGQKLVVSYNPEKEEFDAVNEANGNRREQRVAGRWKRQIKVFPVENLTKPLFVPTDEVDIVFSMRPHESGEYVYLLCSGADHQEAGNASAKIVERFNLKTGKLDRDFGLRTKDMYCGFKYNEHQILNSDVDGMFGTRKQFFVRNKTNTQSPVADFEIRQKFASGGMAFTPAVLLHGREAAYISYSKNIYLWDYALLPHFKRTAIEGGEEAMAEKLKDLLAASLADGGSMAKAIQKQQLKGAYTFDITVGEKGLVTTVFAESDELTHIPSQNALKDLVRAQKFDVDIPKGRRVKFRYVFDL